MTAGASALFRDNGTVIEDFADEFLVVCPECDGCAKVIALNRGAHPMRLFADRRLVCTACGLQRDRPVRGIAYRSGVDW